MSSTEDAKAQRPRTLALLDAPAFALRLASRTGSNQNTSAAPSEAGTPGDGQNGTAPRCTGAAQSHTQVEVHAPPPVDARAAESARSGLVSSSASGSDSTLSTDTLGKLWPPSPARSSPGPLADLDAVAAADDPQAADVARIRRSVDSMSMGRRYALNSSAYMLIRSMAKRSVDAPVPTGMSPEVCLARMVNTAKTLRPEDRAAKLQAAIVHAMRESNQETVTMARKFAEKHGVDLMKDLPPPTKAESEEIFNELVAAITSKQADAPARTRRASSDERCPRTIAKDDRTCEQRKQDALLMAMAWSHG